MKWGLAALAVLISYGCKERLPETPGLERARALVAGAPGTGTIRRTEPPKALEAALTGGKKTFSDDFGRETLGEDWSVVGGDWKLVNEEITVRRADNEGLWLLQQLPEGDVRIEFSVRSDPFEQRQADGTKKEVFPGDLKCEAFSTEPKHQGGYVFIFGGWNNRTNRIARLEEHGDGDGARVVDGPSKAVKPGHTYRMKVVRVGNVMGWYADDEYLAHMEDPELIRGRYFGLNNWRSRLTFDDVAVYDLSKSTSDL